MIMREFFKTLSEAKHFAEWMGACVIDIYGIDKPGTVRKFEQEKTDAEFYGNNLESYRAVVVFAR